MIAARAASWCTECRAMTKGLGQATHLRGGHKAVAAPTSARTLASQGTSLTATMGAWGGGGSRARSVPDPAPAPPPPPPKPLAAPAPCSSNWHCTTAPQLLLQMTASKRSKGGALGPPAVPGSPARGELVEADTMGQARGPGQPASASRRPASRGGSSSLGMSSGLTNKAANRLACTEPSCTPLPSATAASPESPSSSRPGCGAPRNASLTASGRLGGASDSPDPAPSTESLC